MKVLALDSSGPVVTLGVAYGRKILAESRFVTGSKTVGLLTPELQKLLAEGGVGPSDLDGFALGAGPGSFTGLKIGFAAIMGLDFAGEKPIWTFPSLQLTALGLALSAEFKKGLSGVETQTGQPVFRSDSAGMHLDFGRGLPNAARGEGASAAASEGARNVSVLPPMSKVLVLTKAKNGYFYRGVYIGTENSAAECEPLLAQKVEELVWPEERVWVTGSALETDLSEVTGRMRPGDRMASKEHWHPPAGILAQLAATGRLGEPLEKNDTLEPMFLKSFETRFKEMA